MLISRDEGQTWTDPGEGQPQLVFAAGATGAWIAGIHAGLVQSSDGRLLAFGRGDNIDGKMPLSVSHDMGRSWTYQASPFPSLGSGQRLVVLRLQEGPLLLISFGRHVVFRDASGHRAKARACSRLCPSTKVSPGRSSV